MNKSKLNVLISCLLFKGFTGSEMYVYELAKGLTKLNCNVTIASLILSAKMAKLAIDNNINVVDINNIQNFNQFDIIHCQHKPITDFLIEKAPTIKKICTIHSEVMSHNLEDPVKHDSIKHYITIRPEIKQHIITQFGITETNISVIYNPIDQNKFKLNDVKQHNAILFVGTIDYLRKQMLFDLSDYSKETKKTLWLVGENSDTYLPELLKNPYVKHSPSIEDVEEYTQRCSETAGILLGRTTIEGWMCGKPGWIYNIDNKGNILNKEFSHPPDQEELKNKFWSSSVAQNVKDCYLSVLSV